MYAETKHWKLAQVHQEARDIMRALTTGEDGRYSLERLAKMLTQRGTLKKVVESLDFLAQNMSHLKPHDKVRALSLFVEIAKLASGNKVTVASGALNGLTNEQLDQELSRLMMAVRQQAGN